MKAQYLRFTILLFLIFIFNLIFAQQNNNSLNNKERIEVTDEGDTIVYLPYEELYNFGELYNSSPIIHINKDSALLYNDQTQESENLGTLKRRRRSTETSFPLFDERKSVGEIPYTSSNTPTGAKMYSIPIMTANGVGIAPQLSLNYNSMAGNGIAGVGWNISGLSAIHVVPKNLYYDDEISVVDLSQADSYAFSLDGIRLLKNTGKLSENYPYETAQGFVLLRPYNANNGIKYFKAFYPNGSTAIFGFKDGRDLQEHVFPISSLVNSLGFRIDFEYTKSENSYYISKIHYGGKSEDSHLASIHFEYENRDDYSPMYLAGKQIKQDKILKKIVSYNDKEEIRTYNLTHKFQRGVNLLTQFGCSVAELSFNPLLFKYGEDMLGHAVSLKPGELLKSTSRYLSSNFKSGKQEYILGNFTQNSTKSGLVVVPPFTPYEEVATQTIKHKILFGLITTGKETFKKYGSKINPNEEILIFPAIDLASETQRIKVEKNLQTVNVVDIDGDGVNELVKVNFALLDVLQGKDFVVIPNARLKISVYSFKEGKMAAPREFYVGTQGTVFDGPLQSPISRSYYFGSFKGDGKTQLLTVSHNRTFKGEARNSHFALIDLETGELLSEENLFDHFPNESQYVHAIDLDGDGKTELCHATYSGYDVYSLRGNSFEKRASFSEINTSTFDKKCVWGDLNGDGKMDLLAQASSSSSCLIGYEKMFYPNFAASYCDGCGTSYPMRNSSCCCFICEKELQASDKCFNCGEGDVNEEEDFQNKACPNKDKCRRSKANVPVPKYTDNGKRWSIYSFTGNGFDKKNLEITNIHNDDHYFLMDINKDGYADLIQLTSANIKTICLYKSTDYKINVFLNKNGTIEQNATSSVAIKNNTKIIASNISDFYGSADIIAIEGTEVGCYFFSASEDRTRLLTSMIGSHGLQEQNIYKRMDADDHYSTYRASTIKRNYPYYSFIAPLNLLESTNTYFHNYSNYKSYSYYGAVMNREGLGFCGFEEIKSYESNGKKTTTTKMNPEMFGVITDLITPTYEKAYGYSYHNSYQEKKKTYNLQLNSLTEKDKLNETITRKYYSYNQYNNPIKETIFDGYTIRTVLSKHYNNIFTSNQYILGLLKSEFLDQRNEKGERWYTNTEWEHDSNTFLPINRTNFVNQKKTGETHWEYDANGRVISEKSVVYDQSNFLGSTYSYDNTGRYLVTSTNAMGQTTHYADYDKYGNAQTITDHKGRVTTYEYDEFGQLKQTKHPDGSEESAHIAWGGEGLYTLEKKATNSPTSITHYDALGREIKTGIQRFDNSWQYIEKQYDRKGRLLKTSLPFKGAATHWNSYEYDEYDRPIKLTEASGRVNSWEYGEKSVTETKNGIASKKTYDSAGQLIKVEDAGGVITYNLRADGHPESITAPGEIVTQFEYDDYGRQTAIVDPSAGRQTYSEKYENGLLVTTQTDANNKTITTHHDQYGRVTKIERPEFSTTYEYDEEGQLIKENSTNGTLKTFAHDNLGRIVSEKEEIPGGKWFIKSYSYDENQLASVNYASNLGSIASEYFTYRNGYNTEIKLNDEISIWKLIAENALGQPTEALTGVLERSYGYTDYGMPTSRIVGEIQKMSYAFDPLKGNLLSRTDEKRTITETFGYDELNRLSRLGEQNLVYDSNGNIKTMPLTGELSYTHESKPYAVTGLSPISELGTLANQQLTFTSFQRPESITEEGIKASFLYNAVGDRVRMQLEKEGTTQLCRYYLSGQYELDIEGNKAKQRLYLGGTAYSAPAVYVNEGNDWNIYYICRDYLGSITHIVNADGTLQEEYSYDAWGRLRDAGTHTLFSKEEIPSLFLARGYTGHEHLPTFGLVNMNARLYDPMLGRFLSPDPYVQMPDFTQSFNRYSYCLNNPLVYVDENGEWIFTILCSVIPGAQFLLPIAISTDIGWITGGMRSVSQGGTFLNGAWKGGLVGAVGGSIGMIGGAGMPFVSNFLLGAGQGAVTGALDAALWGNNIGRSALYGAISGAAFATLSSEHLKNAVKGKGFKTNEKVFRDMMDNGVGKQEIVDYFGFKGKYEPNKKTPAMFEENSSYFGYADNQGNISYGDEPFTSFDNLYETYTKESYHAAKALKNKAFETQNVRGFRFAPEESLGFIHAYKNTGLYPNTSVDALTQISAYQNQIFDFPESKYYLKKWWHFIYKIPRRW